MRVGKVNWHFHKNLPIHTIDLQPSSYRFVTGGTDNLVCVWNLLPVISEEHEMRKRNIGGDVKPSGGSIENEEQKIVDRNRNGMVQQNNLDDVTMVE